MPCKILVAYQCAKPVGAIINIVPGNHIWGKQESLSAWLKSGGSFETWPRHFSIINVTDKDIADLKYLKERNTATFEHINYLGVPLDSTLEYKSLKTTGEYTCTWSEVVKYLGVIS